MWLYYINVCICKACIGLRNMAQNPKNRKRIGEMGGISAILKLGDSTEASVLRECAACLRNLSLSEELKLLLVKHNALKPLINFAHSSDVELSHQV